MSAPIGPLTAGMLITVLIVSSIKIGLSDLRDRQIRNHDVIVFITFGAAYALLRAIATGSLHALAIEIAIGLLMFAAGFVFWLLAKMGAGDVKYLTATPLAVGARDLLLFLLVLLSFSLISLLLVRFPKLLSPQVRSSFVDKNGQAAFIPYGVLISLAVMLVLVFHLARLFGFL